MDEKEGSEELARIDLLNAREREILVLLSKGFSNQEVALQLHLSLDTVKWYNKHLFAKLGVSSRSQAVAKAAETGIFDSAQPAFSIRIGQPQHNLPAPVTSFVGREQEIGDIHRLLNANRLLVLTGPGGSGKTRLALEAARKMTGEYRDGVWWLELAPLTNTPQMIRSMASLFGIKSSPGEMLLQVIKRYLSRRHLLLILDNFEHIPDSAPLVGDLLAAAEQLTILVTSRERLHIYGECEYPVQPLHLPRVEGREQLQKVLSYEAVQLFVQRAQAIQPGFKITNRDVSAVVEICHHLDGLPLALELAASQIKMNTLKQLAGQLRENFALLSAGPRDLPARQQTLRAAIQWSYSLLIEEEKILFARLAVFKYSGTLDAVTEVCGDKENGDVREALAGLVDKNLVISREMEDGELHFTMLETIHQFAAECLAASGEADRVKQRHAIYYMELAERANQEEMPGVMGGYWFPRLQIERENIIAALQFSSYRPEPDNYLRLIAGMGNFWYYDGQYVGEAQQWVQIALQKMENAPKSLAARVQMTAGLIAFRIGDLADGRPYLQRAYEIFCQMGDESQAAWTELRLSSSYCRTAEDAKQGFLLGKHALDYFRRVNDSFGISTALSNLGEHSRMMGEYGGAKAYYEESLRLFKELGGKLGVAIQYLNLMQVAYYESDPALMEQYARSAHSLFEEIDSRASAVSTLCLFAGASLLSGIPERAARILGAAWTLSEDISAGRFLPVDQALADQLIRETKQALSETAFQAAWEQGAAMSYAELVAYAFEAAG